MPISLNSVADIGSAFEICNAVTKITFTKGTGEGFEYNSNDGSNYRLTPWYNSRNNNIQVKFEEGIKSKTEEKTDDKTDIKTDDKTAADEIKKLHEKLKEKIEKIENSEPAEQNKTDESEKPEDKKTDEKPDENK